MRCYGQIYWQNILSLIISQRYPSSGYDVQKILHTLAFSYSGQLCKYSFIWPHANQAITCICVMWNKVNVVYVFYLFRKIFCSKFWVDETSVWLEQSDVYLFRSWPCAWEYIPNDVLLGRKTSRISHRSPRGYQRRPYLPPPPSFLSSPPIPPSAASATGHSPRGASSGRSSLTRVLGEPCGRLSRRWWFGRPRLCGWWLGGAATLGGWEHGGKIDMSPTRGRGWIGVSKLLWFWFERMKK